MTARLAQQRGAGQGGQQTVEEAARRELTEETGYVAGPLLFGATVTVALPDGTPRVATLFYARYDGMQPIACLEGARIAFVAPDTLDDLLIYPGQQQLIRSTLARITGLPPRPRPRPQGR